jgi:hypothetical protein
MSSREEDACDSCHGKYLVLYVACAAKPNGREVADARVAGEGELARAADTCNRDVNTPNVYRL